MSMFGYTTTAPELPEPPALAVTDQTLRRLAPGGKPTIIAGIAARFDGLAASYDVTTRLRLCHFMAQAAHETDGFRTLEEYGGPAYFARYDGRRDLGNTQAGDGARYHGRGVFQLTGRWNYRGFGSLLGIDLEGHPELAKRPDHLARHRLRLLARTRPQRGRRRR
jgi:putative chitinase